MQIREKGGQKLINNKIWKHWLRKEAQVSIYELKQLFLNDLDI